MKISEIARRPVAIPQGVSTRRLYGMERRSIEQVWDMRRPRGLKTLQAAFDLLWAHYAPIYRVHRMQPISRFGPGTKYHGRYLSYTMAQGRGQPWVIELAPNERNFYVLVHELVHALGPTQHGVKFSEIYHDLLSHDTFRHMMRHPEAQKFMHYLKNEHPALVRRAYRRR